MPRGNGTGPMGMGRMTGRGAGFCVGLDTPGYAKAVGYAGFGGRRGFRHMFHAMGMMGRAGFGYFANDGGYVPTDEKEFLKKQARFLENQLEQVKRHISNLD